MFLKVAGVAFYAICKETHGPVDHADRRGSYRHPPSGSPWGALGGPLGRLGEHGGAAGGPFCLYFFQCFFQLIFSPKVNSNSAPNGIILNSILDSFSKQKSLKIGLHVEALPGTILGASGRPPSSKSMVFIKKTNGF